MNSCKKDGVYVLWRGSKRDPAYACEKHVGRVAAAMVGSGDLTKPLQIAVSPVDDAPCLYSVMCESR